MSKRRSGLSAVAGNVDEILARNRDKARPQAEDATSKDDPKNDSVPPSPTMKPKGGVTGVGALFSKEEKGLRAQLEALQSQLAASGATKVPTSQIVPSRFYNRFEMDLDADADPDFKELLASVVAGGGNSIPVLLNRIDGKDKDELVYGHRRWAACRSAGVDVLAYVHHNLEPKVIARLQLIENSDRKDPSVLDRAQQVFSQMESGAWDSQAALSREMGVSTGQVSRLLDIARHIPKSLQMAHPNHHKITFNQAKALSKLAVSNLPTLKKRIEEIRVRRASLSAEEATNLLLNGERHPDTGGRVKVQWTASPTGLTLKIRGFSTARNLELTKKIEELLSQYGLNKDA